MTPAPMISAVGVSVDRRWAVAIGGSLRWHDPDRFDGFDLSRVLRHPRPSEHIIGSLARSGKALAARLGAAAECQAPGADVHVGAPCSRSQREVKPPTSSMTAPPSARVVTVPK